MQETGDYVINNITDVKIEPSNVYSKTFTAFCGADMIIYLGNKIIGEAQAIDWEKDLTGGRTWPIKGTLTCALFDREPLELEDRGYNIYVEYLNEYGQAMLEEFHNVNFHRVRGGMTIDSFYNELRYEFTASRRVFKGNLTGEDITNERAKRAKAEEKE